MTQGLSTGGLRAWVVRPEEPQEELQDSLDGGHWDCSLRVAGPAYPMQMPAWSSSV